MIPKFFLHLFSKFSLKKSNEEEELNITYLSYLTNYGKYTDPDKLLALQVDISILSKPVKKFLYKYDCSDHLLKRYRHFFRKAHPISIF